MTALICAIAAACCASLLLQIIVLALQIPYRRRRLTHLLKREAIDEGIALSERMERAHKMPAHQKMMTALSHARETLAHHGVKTTDAELRKILEARLERAEP